MLLRKNHIQILLQALVVILALVSCTDDDFVGNRGSSNNGTPHYLAIKLKMDSNSSTRADEKFDYGTADDHIMGPSGNIAILFKGSELFGIYDLDKRNSENNDEDTEAQYLYIQQLPVDKEVDFPTSCLVVLNGSNDICNDLNEKTTVNDVLNYIWKADPENIGYADTNHQYFTMSNSMYNGSGATPFNAEDHIFQTKDSAAMFPIIVPIERVVAKVQFAVDEKIFTPGEPEDKTEQKADPLIFFDGISNDGKIEYAEIKRWRINVTGWGVNALETQSHIFKHINAPTDGYYSDWNSPDGFRSYWSEDPHYTDDQALYPWQYRFAVEDNNIYYYSQAGKPSPLKNYSYDYFCGETTKDGFNRSVYIPENTYGKLTQPLDSRTNLLAGTHVIVCAELQVETNDLDNFPEGYMPGDVYRDRNGIYYKSERECFVSLVHSFNNTLKSQESMKYLLYDWKLGGSNSEWAAKTSNQGGVAPMLYYKDTPMDTEFLLDILNNMTDEEFELKFGMMKEATIQHGDGKRLPWFEDENGNLLVTIKPNLNIYKPDIISKDPNGPGYVIDYGKPRGTEDGGPDATNDDIKSVLYEWVGAVDHFNNGKMYYSVPVMHNGVNHKENANQETLGDYGVVRNHFYTFELESIKGIGTSVDDSNQPIVPDRVDINDVINMKIYIIPWHTVSTTAPVY